LIIPAMKPHPEIIEVIRRRLSPVSGEVGRMTVPGPLQLPSLPFLENRKAPHEGVALGMPVEHQWEIKVGSPVGITFKPKVILLKVGTDATLHVRGAPKNE
jgi:hypothetical protein